MYLYILFGILVILTILEIGKVRIRKFPRFYKVAYWYVIFFFLFLSSFRWENGTDWISYLDYWNAFPDVTVEGYMEVGYTFLSSFTHWAWNNYTIHLSIMAFVCILPVSFIIYRYSPYPFLGLLVWLSCYFAHIFPVRQTIAVSLIVFSYRYISRCELFKYIICLALAFSFHYTSIVALPLYWIWNTYFTRKTILLILCCTCGFSLLYSSFVSDIMFLLGGDFFNSQLQSYLGDDSDNTFGQLYTPQQVLVRGLMNRALLLVVGLLLLNRLRVKDRFFCGIFNAYVAGTLIFLLVVPLAVVGVRLCAYYDIAQVFILPFLFTLKMTKENRIVLYILVCFYLYIKFKGIIVNYQDLYIPYHFVLLK